MEILLIRHTTPAIEKGVCYGQSDLHLVDSYRKEFEKVQEEIGVQSFPMIYSSPLLRCSQLANHLSSNVIFDDRIKELDFGHWEMIPWADINQDDLNVWMNDFVNVQVPNGESYVDLQQRSVQFVEEIKKEQKDSITIITHAGVIRSLWAYANSIPLKKSFDLKLNYGSHIKISI